jgi:hypothetical protein
MRMKDVLKITTLAIAVAFGAAACDDDNPSDPSDETYKFRADLTTANEVPPVTNEESGASGTANITLNVTRNDAGTITAATADFQVQLANFPDATPITAAHIHTGTAGNNGPFVVNLELNPGEITLGNGNGTVTKNGIVVSVDVANALIANPASFYFNAHTQLNPGGAVRGQLQLID